MLLISCPWCGLRDETEFSYGGEAHIARPQDPEKLSDEQWADYLFLRANPKGTHLERWVHTHGCRRWFNAARNTVTDEISAIYRIGERPPIPEAPAPPSRRATDDAPDDELRAAAQAKPGAKSRTKSGTKSGTSSGAKTKAARATSGTAKPRPKRAPRAKAGAAKKDGGRS